MFLTRTVAAEICMEAKSNEAAYNALKILDKNKVLKFELSWDSPYTSLFCITYIIPQDRDTRSHQGEYAE